MIGQSVQQILLEHYQKRQSDNPRYSMRAYARDLRLSPGQLSLVMSGKKGISLERAKTMVEVLDLSPIEKEYFINQVELSFSRSQAAKSLAESALKKLRQHEDAFYLSKETFTAISDWYHLGILQVMQIQGYSAHCKKKGETQFLAAVLKVPEADIQDALVRLVKLETLKAYDGYHVPVQDYILTKGEVPSAAIRKFHRQMIQKALVAIEAQTVEERFLNTTLICMERADYPKLLEDFKAFYRMVMNKYGKNNRSKPKGDSVYALTIQLFKAAHLDGEKK